MSSFEEDVNLVYEYFSNSIHKTLSVNPKNVPLAVAEAIEIIRLHMVYPSMKTAVDRLYELHDVAHRLDENALAGLAVQEALRIWIVDVRGVLKDLADDE